MFMGVGRVTHACSHMQGHKRLEGASLIPADPTVLLTIAGMLQFKPVFLGQAPAAVPRATTTQKCVRVSDIENIGLTARHHTFFEVRAWGHPLPLCRCRLPGSRRRPCALHACMQRHMRHAEAGCWKAAHNQDMCSALRMQMLGAFSFGDYFKEEAIRMAWELSTVKLGIPAHRIWVSVYEDDDEAAALWRDVVGFPAERLVRLGDADNFWASG